MKRFRGGLVFKAFVSLNSRLESNKEEEEDLLEIKIDKTLTYSAVSGPELRVTIREVVKRRTGVPHLQEEKKNPRTLP